MEKDIKYHDRFTSFFHASTAARVGRAVAPEQVENNGTKFYAGSPSCTTTVIGCGPSLVQAPARNAASPPRLLSR